MIVILLTFLRKIVMKRNLLGLMFLSLLAMPLCSYGMGPIQQTGLPFEAVKERINEWFRKDDNYKKGPWYKEVLGYINRKYEVTISNSRLKVVDKYPEMWVLLGGAEYFNKLRKMTIGEVAVSEFGKSFPIFVALRTTYSCYVNVKSFGFFPFITPTSENLEAAYGEAIIRRIGDQIDQYVEEQSKQQ
jgi:hypothetical protein